MHEKAPQSIDSIGGLLAITFGKISNDLELLQHHRDGFSLVDTGVSPSIVRILAERKFQAQALLGPDNCLDVGAGCAAAAMRAQAGAVHLWEVPKSLGDGARSPRRGRRALRSSHTAPQHPSRGITDVFISNCAKRLGKPLIRLVVCLQLLLAKLVTGNLGYAHMHSLLAKAEQAVEVRACETFTLDFRLALPILKEAITVTASAKPELAFESISSVGSFDSFDLATLPNTSLDEALEQ